MTQVTPHNAFTPAKEIQDIDRFAGRVDVLDALSAALQSDGAQIILYGQRGIGKSSLSRVLTQIAKNDVAAISRINEKPHKSFDYLPIYITCDDSVCDIDKLCLRLLTDEQALAPWIPFKITERKSGTEGGGKLGIKILELSGKISGSISERKNEIDSDALSTSLTESPIKQGSLPS